MFHDASWPLEGFLAAWVSSALYGMNVVATAAYVQISVMKGLNTTYNRVLLAVALVQFCLATVHVAVCLRSAIEGLLHSPDTIAYFQDQGNSIHLAQTTSYITNSLIADAILAWRLYVVWGQRRWTCIPYGIMICAAAVCAYASVGNLVNHHDVELLYAELVKKWAVATWSLSISIQVSATLLIAWKLWVVHSASCKIHNDRTIVSIMWVILESGAVLSTATVFLLAFYVEKLTAGGIIVAMIGQLATLVPTSILVRVTITNRVATQSTTSGTVSRPRDISVHFAGKSASETTTDPGLYGSQRDI